MKEKLIEQTKQYLAWLESLKEEPSDQHLLDDGWIRHTGDVCPVHEWDKIKVLKTDLKTWYEDKAYTFDWSASWKVTYYKITKKYDPHAENKALYAQDALVHKEPWELWECLNPRNSDKEFRSFCGHPSWHEHVQYRRKQMKPQMVSWSCPLLKGANTNYGELLDSKFADGYWRCSDKFKSTIPARELRLAHTDATPSNWQAYNGEDLNLLHEAGFVVELRYSYVGVEGNNIVESVTPYLKGRTPLYIAAYRVIAIREGFSYV